jgi:DNA-binding XRE family transcriptional regulator
VTTGVKPWDLGLGPSEDNRVAQVLGFAGSTFSDLIEPVEEFGYGPNRVFVGHPRNDPSHYILRRAASGGTGPLRALNLENAAVPAVSYLYGQLPIAAFPATYPMQADVLEAVEGLRSRLDLTIETTARLLGVEKRTYHGWKSGEPMPMSRLQTAMNALVALGRLAADDPAAARKVFEGDTAEATKLVSTGQFAALRALVDRASATIARELAAVSPAIDARPELPDGVDVQRALELVSSADFRAVTAYMQGLAPETRATTAIWKVRALLELQAAVARLSSGDALGDDWLFLVAMTRSGLEALEERALSLLRDPNKTGESWIVFLTEEAERAWSGYSVPVAEPAEKGSHDSDASARPADLYDFSRSGFDLATGKIRKTT